MSNMLPTSGHDGTVRVWNLPDITNNAGCLQQTCIMHRGDLSVDEVDGKNLSYLCSNSSGHLLAASFEDMVNIWSTECEINMIFVCSVHCFYLFGFRTQMCVMC